MITEAGIQYGQPTYEHNCPDMEDGVIDRIYDEYNPWSNKYMGWIMQMDNGRDYPDSMRVNFCPYCGEKLPEHTPRKDSSEINLKG